MTMFTEDKMQDLKPLDWIEVDQTFLTWMGITTNYPLGKRLVVHVIFLGKVIAYDDNGYVCEIPLDIANRMRATWLNQVSSVIRVSYYDNEKINRWIREAKDPYLEQGFSRLNLNQPTQKHS